jgi:serine/threonine-protein kinase
MAIAAGTKLGQYEVLGPLGSGGMGEVYRARDVDLRREVAIKVLPEHLSSNIDRLRRFEVEARLASSLNHPNIVTIYAIGVSGSTRYTVMELVDGPTLAEEMEHVPLSIDRILQIAIQVADGLAKAHEAGVVHRDLKPQNIMLSRDGFAKIVDFGLSKVVIAPGNSADAETLQPADNTAPGILMGTVDYISPEQALGREFDFRSDQFSLGCVLYEMITRQRPFRRATAVHTLAAIIDADPPSAGSINISVPRGLDTIVRRCLEKAPDKRYASTSDIARELREAHATLSRSMTGPADTLNLSGYIGFHKKKMVAAGLILAAILASAALAPRIRQSVGGLHLPSIAQDQQVAVLPFTNVGGDPSAQAFCDGLVEVLTSKLTQLQSQQKGLHIVPASEIRSEKIESAKQALSSFGANVVVTGSVQRGADKVRLTINLVDPKQMRQLQAISIDAELHDISVMQDGIVIRVAEMLGLRMDGDAKSSVLSGGTTEPNAYDYYVQGRGYLQRFEQLESVDQAITLFTSATSRDPQYTLAYAALGEAYWRKYVITKDPSLVQEARTASEKALSGSQNIAGAHFTLALIEAGAGHHESAVASLQRALSIDPINSDYYREMALDLGNLGKIDDAIGAFNKAISLQPNGWANYNAFGAFYYQRARYPEAEAQFRKAISLSPDNARAFRNLGAALYSQDRYDEAAGMFEKSAALQPSDTVALTNLGAVYFMVGRYKDSAQTLERALAINGNSYRTWFNFAEALFWTPGERDKAKQAYEQAAQKADAQLKVNPRQARVITDLADCYSRLGQADRARDLLQQALQISPDEADILYHTGSVYEQLGDRKRALQFIGKALGKGYSRDLVQRSPTLAELRKDPQFASIQSKTSP